MTGARLEVEPFYPFYDNVRPNATLAALTEQHARRVGMNLTAPDTGPGIWASTDFGNVSQTMPSFAMDFAVSEEPVPLHTAQMQAVSTTDLAHQNALYTAKVLAATACDLLADPQLVTSARGEFAERAVALARSTPPASEKGS